MKTQRSFLGHPMGLAVLFTVEMWERFSFYGMRALLVIYLTTEVLAHRPDTILGFGFVSRLLGFDPQGASGADWGSFASHIYGLYSGLVYFTPLIGGWLADRWFGKKRMIVGGALLIAAGHLVLTTHRLFLLALLLVIAGTGGVKGNIAAQVGDLYAPDDARRERGFSLFYVGINVGATAAPLLCAWLAHAWGWTVAFEATTLGMMLGLATYAATARWLPEGGQRPMAEKVQVADEAGQYGGQGARWGVLAMLSLAAVFLFLSYEQQANAMMRWIVTAPDDIAMGWIQAIPPAVVLVGTPALTLWWGRQARQGREPDPFAKILIGALIVLAAQAMLPLMAMVGHGKSPPIPALLVYFALWEVGDLFFSPAAMGLYSRLAPRGAAAVTMALWYLTVFAGNIASGWLGGLWGRLPPVTYWTLIAALTSLCAAIVALLRRQGGRTCAPA